MERATRVDFDATTSINVEEDEETLAAIDDGIRGAAAGRTVPMEEVRKLPRLARFFADSPLIESGIQLGRQRDFGRTISFVNRILLGYSFDKPKPKGKSRP